MYDANERNIIQLLQQNCALGTELYLFINDFLFVCRVAFTPLLQPEERNSCSRTTSYCIIAIHVQLKKGLHPAMPSGGGGYGVYSRECSARGCQYSAIACHYSGVVCNYEFITHLPLTFCFQLSYLQI